MGYKRAKKEMKKVFIILLSLIAVLIGTTSYLYAIPNNYGQCVAFKNVTATIVEVSDEMICGCFESKNEGTTKVTYKVTGWYGNRPEVLRSGVIDVPAYGKVRTKNFSTNGCYNISVEIHNCHSSSL